MSQDALCPPAAVAGTHHKEVLRDLINEEGVSSASRCRAVLQGQEHPAPICQEQRLTAHPAVLRPCVAPVSGTQPCIPIPAEATTGQSRGLWKASGEPEAASPPRALLQPTLTSAAAPHHAAWLN